MVANYDWQKLLSLRTILGKVWKNSGLRIWNFGSLMSKITGWIKKMAVDVGVSKIWQVTVDMWRMKHDTWHMKHDTWHVTHDILI